MGEFDLGSGRGGRRPSVEVAVREVRSLTEADLPALADATPTPAQLIRRVSHTHHQAARMLAQGSEVTSVALATGYDVAYVSRLKGDPSFKDLLAYYSAEREAIFVDALERMKALGLNSIEELQKRLEDDPESWSNGQLMDLAELMLVKPHRAASAGGAGPSSGSSVVVNVKFMGGGAEGATLEGEARVIDG